jgi:signal transduction histidine kinase
MNLSSRQVSDRPNNIELMKPRSIQANVNKLNGRLQVGSSPRGTTLVIEIPVWD